MTPLTTAPPRAPGPAPRPRATVRTATARCHRISAAAPGRHTSCVTASGRAPASSASDLRGSTPRHLAPGALPQSQLAAGAEAVDEDELDDEADEPPAAGAEEAEEPLVDEEPEAPDVTELLDEERLSVR